MTTMTLETIASTRRLEELVDRLLAALLGNVALADTAPVSLVKTVHEARRLRQAGHLHAALEVFHGVDTGTASESELQWLYAEWRDVARRRFVGESALLYSPDTGKAAALLEQEDGSLEVVAILGMRWPAGKAVSRCSLRGLKPLHKQGGASWS